MREPEAVKVSVVIATYGREQVLCDTVRQVLAQTYPDFEVIVVDQTERHEPETVRFLEEVGDRVRLVKLDRPSVTVAENEGIRRARGEVVLFLDDDVRIAPGLIAAHVRNYRDRRWAGVGGLVIEAGRPPSRHLPRVVTNSDAGWFFFMHNYDRRTEVRVAQGCNMSFRRRVLVEVGGVDEGFLENAVHWELDLCNRISQAGGGIVHDPEAHVLHLKHPVGGCRMGRTKAQSFFDNYMRVIFRHLGRHQRPLVLWRLLRDYVLVDGQLDPVAVTRMCWRMGRALVRALCRGTAEPVLGLADERRGPSAQPGPCEGGSGEWLRKWRQREVLRDGEAICA